MAQVPAGQGGGMKINHQVVVFDTEDLGAESAFWTGVLGARSTPTTTGAWSWEAAGRRATGARPRSAGLAGRELVLSLGAEVLQEPVDESDHDVFQVYSDPAGHPCCLCWLTPKAS